MQKIMNRFGILIMIIMIGISFGLMYNYYKKTHFNRAVYYCKQSCNQYDKLSSRYIDTNITIICICNKVLNDYR